MLKNKSETEVLRIRLFRKKLIRGLSVLGIFILLGYAVSPWVKIGFNGTSSVNGYVFLIVKNVAPERGELMAFWPKKNNFYNNIWFVKYVKGMPGDVIDVKDRGVYINGSHVGDAKTKSKTDGDLHVVSPGVIPAQHYFAWTPHKDSFDSRYEEIGLVSENSVIGRAYRIF
mgnify:CR=1 FL=1